MSVEKLMTTRVVSVEMDDSLETIGEIFRNLDFHHLLVVEDKRLVGIISDRDYLKAVSPYLNTLSEMTQDRATLNKRAHHIMSRHPISVSKETSMKLAAQLMLEKGIGCLPITDDKGIVQGMITWRDLLKGLLQINTVTARSAQTALGSSL